MKLFLLFCSTLLAMIIGVVQVSYTVAGVVPTDQFVYWFILYTVGILGMAFSMLRMHGIAR